MVLTPPAQTAIQEDLTIKRALDKILAEQKRTNQLLEAVVRNVESFQITHAANIDYLRAKCKEMALENTNLAKSLLEWPTTAVSQTQETARQPGIIKTNAEFLLVYPLIPILLEHHSFTPDSLITRPSQWHIHMNTFTLLKQLLKRSHVPPSNAMKRDGLSPNYTDRKK